MAPADVTRLRQAEGGKRGVHAISFKHTCSFLLSLILERSWTVSCTQQVLNQLEG